MNDTIFKIDGSEANISIEISGITRNVLDCIKENVN
ncbi:hypothetical protein PFFVO_03064 [Plasmodium falciparum Vietnam Oak-Knoll (FVO)]|uniref:Uncharacterized protein n=1 Tax=Plasmodium falciparum Vietnam Oak-Knoll (FVO) TaxID=1036723 RepID=A0A024V4T2_PLAFA|nr:hypothetical protein PFFVO_03064 [Plasmodium falciparum Vietnam Oak-Knoll (FVO)]